jgi:hypothetical protein
MEVASKFLYNAMRNQARPRKDIKTMKNLVILASFAAFAAQAREVVSDRANAQVNIARVTAVMNLVNKPEIMVNVSIQDLGGSTDVSPTQKVFLNLYAKGEMFSTDASFEIANVLEVVAARRFSGGVYEVKVKEYNDTIETVTYRINAVDAVNAIMAVDCGDEFDCDASTNFASKVSVTKVN